MKIFLVCATLFMTVLWSFVFMPPSASGQDGAPPVAPKSQIASLVADAEAAQSHDTIMVYSEHLIRMIVDPKAGDPYIAMISRRLATAEVMTQHGKRKLIPESKVAQAFNEMMMRVTDASPQSPQTNVSEVHRLRKTLYGISPALSSVNSHESELSPNEAVLLMWLLPSNIASALPDPSQPQPTQPGTVRLGRRSSTPPTVLIARYVESKPPFDSVKLYDHMAMTLGI